MPIRVTAAENVGNGTAVDVTLSGAPVGALTFKKSRLPADAAATAAAAVLVSGTTYRVTVRATGAYMRLHYYVQAFDGATQLESFQHDRTGGKADETCVWVCAGDPGELRNHLADHVVDILADNLQALDRGMRDFMESDNFPSGKRISVQRIHKGIPALEEGGEFPRISVRFHEKTDDPYFGNPRSDYPAVKATITCYYCHQGIVSWEPLISALTGAVEDVLNQIQYIEYDLASGLGASLCMATAGRTEEFYDEGTGTWVALGTIDYTANVLMGRESL